MKVSSEQIENRQVALNIEMEQVEVEKYLDKAYQKLVTRISVPGFRKGKTPKNILENLIGKETLLQEAIEYLVPDVYKKALEQEKIEPVERPQIEILKLEPVSFKAIVPLQPTVELGDYKKIRIEYKTEEVKDEEVESTLLQIQYQQSTLVPVDRAAELGDIVTIDISGEEGGKPIPLRKDLVYELSKDSKLPLPGFAEKLTGSNKGEERNFTLSYHTDYEIKELADKKYSFNVKINEVKKRELSEINDELAKSVGTDDLASLKENIRQQLKARNEQKAARDLEQKIIEGVAEISKVEYPPVLSELEIDEMTNEEARNFPDAGKGLENYLKSIGKTLDDHRKELQPIAQKKVTNTLLIQKITEAEGIKVEPSEIEKEIEKMAGQSEKEAENIQKLFELPQTRKSLERYLAQQKTIDYLKNMVTEKSTNQNENLEAERNGK